MDKTTKNSCCFCFSLKTGTISILIFDLVYLIAQYFFVGITYDIFGIMAKEPKMYYAVSSLIVKILKVEMVLYLLCSGLALTAIAKEAGNFLTPLLILKIVIIVFDVLFMIINVIFLNHAMREYYSYEKRFVAGIIYIGIVITIETIFAYHWNAVYHYYKQLKREHWGDPVNFSQRRARAIGESPYPPNTGAGPYPRAQDSSPYNDRRADAQPGGQGGSGKQGGSSYGDPRAGPPQPPYGGSPYGIRRPPYADEQFYDFEKNTGGLPLAGGHPRAANSPRGGASPAKSRPPSKDNHSSPGSVKDDIVPDVQR